MDTASEDVNRSALSISLVAFHPNHPLLVRTLASLAEAGAVLTQAKPDMSMHLHLVDNGGLPNIRANLAALEHAGIGHTLVSGHGNVGYGKGHNLALNQVPSRYHLVLNPDIEMEPGSLLAAVAFLEAHPETGLLSPTIVDEAGKIQYLCRQYPALFDLFVRGFLPRKMRRYFSSRLARYEMHAQINEHDTVWEPLLVSGCFMFFRTDVLKKLGGFDPRYFLYFEDYDLSMRAHDVARVVHVPKVRVLHHGGGASRKGFAHIKMFATSAYKFYNRFGWKWF
jgi:GT2 family glycosyltransferase